MRRRRRGVCFTQGASLLVVIPMLLVFRLTAYVDTEGAVELLVGGGDDDREVGVATPELVDVVAP